MLRFYHQQIQDLYHYGIPKKSGRYPYGSGDRPYQSGGETSKVLRKGTISDSLIDHQKHIADKPRVLKEGRASEVLKYKGELSNDELIKVCKRFEYEKKLEDYAKAEIKDNMKKIDEMMKNLKTFNEWASIGTDTYNMMASIYNTTSEGKKKPLTKIEQGSDGNRGKGKGKK